MRKNTLLALLLSMLFLFASCFTYGDGESSTHEAVNLDVSDTDSSESESSAYQIKTTDFFIPNQTADGFVVSNQEFDGTIEGMIAKLVELDALPSGTTVLSFELSDDTAAINLSKPFEDAMSGTAAEYLLIGALVNTILDYYDIDTVSLKVEGATLDTGHNIYSEPLSRYE